MNSNLDLPPRLDAPSALALSVTCLAESDEMHAVVHELAAPDRTYAEFYMAVLPG